MNPIPKQRSLPSITFLILALLWLPNLAFGQLNVSIAKTNITCFGAANGQATANPSGGVPPYTYAWSNSGTSQNILNLSPGAYTVTVTDANQGTKTVSANITQPPNLGVATSSQSQICDIAPDGSASAVPYGGTPPYAFLWSNGKTNPFISQLTAGTYTVTLTDSKGCTDSDSTLVNTWDEGLWTMTSITPDFCSQHDGSAHISLASGTPPFLYLWNTGDTTSEITNLSAGTYTVTVTDLNGCSTEVTTQVTEQGISINYTTTISICGYETGTASLYPSSGTPPYQYLWSNGATTQTIDSLPPNNYYATVTDATGCTGEEDIVVSSSGGNPIIGHQIPHQCLNKLATFTVENPSPLYPEFQWSLSNPLDQIISGQGTDSILVQWASIGSRVVTVLYANNGIICGGFDFFFTVVVCAGTNDLWLSEADISPNPFDDLLQIQLAEGTPDDAKAILTDISGKTIFEKACSRRDLTLETAAYPPGVYFLKIRSKQGERVWKLVKI